MIADELNRYLGCDAWVQQKALEELPGGTFERHQRLHRIAKLNDGKGLGYRTVLGALRN